MIVHAIPKIRFTCRFSIIVSHYYVVHLVSSSLNSFTSFIKAS